MSINPDETNDSIAPIDEDEDEDMILSVDQVKIKKIDKKEEEKK